MYQVKFIHSTSLTGLETGINNYLKKKSENNVVSSVTVKVHEHVGTGTLAVITMHCTKIKKCAVCQGN